MNNLSNKRIIPVLTIMNNKMVKTIKFKRPNYIGDPINAVKIFNDKQVDEAVLLDISATIENREPNYSKIEEICSEAFMPFAYGGGIKNIDQVKLLFQLGIEKIVLNSVLSTDLDLVKKIAAIYGSQSIIASVDVKRNIFGKGFHPYINSGKKKLKITLDNYVKDIENAGAGEILLNSIDKDGTYLGFEIDLVKSLAKKLTIPLIICGGAGSNLDLKMGLDAGASAVSAGSLFVYRGRKNGILINYPDQNELNSLFE